MEKKLWDEQKKVISEKRQVDNDLYEQRFKSVQKALKRKRR